MIAFACPKCSAAHHIPPQQAGLTFRCSCGHTVQAPAAPRASADVQPAAPDRTARSRKVWYYELDGRAVGPVSEADLKLLAENDTLRPDARAWTEGMAGWQPAAAVVPRAFADVEVGGSGLGLQWGLALLLAGLAAGALALFVFIALWGKKPAPATTEPTKTARVAPAARPAPVFGHVRERCSDHPRRSGEPSRTERPTAADAPHGPECHPTRVAGAARLAAPTPIGGTGPGRSGEPSRTERPTAADPFDFSDCVSTRVAGAARLAAPTENSRPA